jgi:hypothetical protein
MSPGDSPALQGLVQWSDMPPSFATWENMDALCRRFPATATWGQVASQGEGIVSSTLPADRDEEDANEDVETHQRPKRVPRPSARVCGPEWRV